METLIEDTLVRAPAPARAPRWLLVAGLLGGVTAAAVGLFVAPAAHSLPAGAVARVNDHLIARDAWLRAVAAVASERRTPLTDDDQRRILDRLIDEELLVQHGIALGLAERDARLRSTMVSEVMLAATNAAATLPDDAGLRAYYDSHREYFAPAGRLRVQAWRLDSAGNRLEFQPAIPDALLPPAKLAAYVGPALAQRAAQLAPGQVSAPLETAGGRVVLQVSEKQPADAPPFELVRDEVRAQMKRDADEAAVRSLLAQLRASNAIVVAPGLL
jgi:hypothetical protein